MNKKANIYEINDFTEDKGFEKETVIVDKEFRKDIHNSKFATEAELEHAKESITNLVDSIKSDLNHDITKTTDFIKNTLAEQSKMQHDNNNEIVRWVVFGAIGIVIVLFVTVFLKTS